MIQTNLPRMAPPYNRGIDDDLIAHVLSASQSLNPRTLVKAIKATRYPVFRQSPFGLGVLQLESSTVCQIPNYEVHHGGEMLTLTQGKRFGQSLRRATECSRPHTGDSAKALESTQR